MTRQGENNPFFGHHHTPAWIADHRARFTKWTDADLLQIRVWYDARRDKPLRLDELASVLGRRKESVSRKARELGLTDTTRKTGRRRRAKHATEDERRAAISESSRARIAKNGHPRGALGMKHSDESRAKISASLRALVASGTHPGQRPRSDETRAKLSLSQSKRLRLQQSNPYSRCLYGRRPDLGNLFFRSRWEANYARFLNWLQARGEIEGWEYEADTFWFEAIRRGVRSYTPDFKVKERGAVYYVEVKGWMDAKSKTKIARMAKYHPTVELRVFGAKAYAELAKKLGAAIPGWECDDRGRP